MNSHKRFTSWANISCRQEVPKQNISKDSGKAIENVCFAEWGRQSEFPTRNTKPLTSTAVGGKSLQVFLLRCIHCPLSAGSINCFLLLLHCSLWREAGCTLSLVCFRASWTLVHGVYLALALKNTYICRDYPHYNNPTTFQLWHFPFSLRHPISVYRK